MKKQLIYRLLIFVVTLILPAIAFTQPFSPPPPPADPVDTIPADIPFDGGLSILLAAGVGYGVKKTRDQRKQNKEKSQ
jgi:hypothetical protein